MTKNNLANAYYIFQGIMVIIAVILWASLVVLAFITGPIESAFFLTILPFAVFKLVDIACWLLSVD